MVGKRLSRVMDGGAYEAGAYLEAKSRSWREYLLRFALSLTLACVRIFGSPAPFAVSATAASGCGISGLAALLGSVAGYLLSAEPAEALKSVGACMIVFILSRGLRRTSVYYSKWLMPLCSAASSACMGMLTLIEGDAALSDAARFAASVVLSGGFTVFFKTALSPWSGRLNFDRGEELTHTVSVIILLSAVMMALSRLELFGAASVGRALAMTAVLAVAYRGGVGAGCCFGVALGLAMDASSEHMPFFCMAYGLGGLVSGVFTKHGKLIFAASFIIITASISAAGAETGAVPSVLYEMFMASVIFMLLPSGFLAKIGAVLPGGAPGKGAERSAEHTKLRMEMTSLALQDLYDTARSVETSDKNDGDVAGVFDRAAERVCRRCQNVSCCWSQNFAETQDIMNNLAPEMLRRGSVSKDDFPARFSEKCLHPEELSEAISSELRALLYRRQFRSRLQTNRSIAYNRYLDMASILSGISEGLSDGGGWAPEYETKITRFLSSVGTKADVAAFRMANGRLCIELSGGDTGKLMRDRDILEKLSSVTKTRLCTNSANNTPERAVFLEAEPYAASVGVSGMASRGKKISGDRGAYFKTDEGTLYVILSDGCGTGSEAAEQSGTAVSMLERFLRAGVSAETSVRMLNDILVLKNEDDIVCATVDLISIDLFTGEAHLFKYGAAPTYLKKGSNVKRINGESLAAGLGTPPDDVPDHLKMELSPGMCAVIVSDGVTSGLDDGWLTDIIAEKDDISPKELSRTVITAAAERFGTDDDMTVYAICLTERN